MKLFSALGSFFTSIRDWFADPKTQAAIVNVEHVAEAIVCDISAGAKLALGVEALVAVDGAAVAATGLVYASSALVCSALGGVPTGQTAINVSAVTKVG